MVEKMGLCLYIFSMYSATATVGKHWLKLRKHETQRSFKYTKILTIKIVPFLRYKIESYTIERPTSK